MCNRQRKQVGLSLPSLPVCVSNSAFNHSDFKKNKSQRFMRFQVNDEKQIFLYQFLESCYKVGTQIGTQKCAERAVEAVDAVHAVRILPRKFSAC
jgi:hypothetical protein